ncbi:cupin domain-containing protein [Kribbella sp. NPDC048928]|uniref:cupin domain-containing protein n=1 Tax=Kribbella sp. NPDC048928 TaxID=3364111 RepID=UPI00371FD4B0
MVQFEAGGRTAWHVHENGQLLICVDGVGFVGNRDGTVVELRPGSAVWTDAGEQHWHGAGPDRALTHVAVQTESTEDAVMWFEEVAEADWLRAGENR